MRIVRVILTTNYSPWSRYTGGTQRSTHYLARALARDGHDVTVIYTKAHWERIHPPAAVPYRLRWAEFAKLWSKHSAPVRFLTARSVARAVDRELARDSAERTVVHANGEEGALVPFLRARHDFRLVVTPRYPTLPSALVSGRTMSSFRKIDFAVRQSKYVMLRAALRGADLCAPPSGYGAKLIRRAYGLSPTTIRIVHNGVPDEFLTYRWRPQAPENRPFLFFGRYTRSKGIDTLLAAFGRLQTNSPPLRLVGAGSERGWIEREIARRGLGSRVEVLGWADHETLGRLLESSSAVVLPSREENFGLAVLAAMAVGTPLVATDVGGTREGPQDGVHALLVRPDDVAGLEHALRRLIADPDAAAERGTAAAELVRREFTWARAAAKFAQLYEGLFDPAAKNA